MNIKQVKTAIKIGDFKLRNDKHKNKIKLDYLRIFYNPFID